MPGPYAPSDSLIGPIIHELALIIASEIPSIAHVYEEMPDRAPMDNSVLLPMTRIKVLDDTNGKMKILMTIGARHLFRRREFDLAIQQAYSYIMPWLQMLDAWPNQTLGGLVIEVNPHDVQVTKVMESGQVFVALATAFDVLTEFNIPLV